MSRYTYKGLNENNQKVKGNVSAQTEQEAYHKLKNQKIVAFDLVEHMESDSGTTMHKLSAKELAEFSRQIGVMQSSGITVLKAIQIMRDKGANKKVAGVYNYLYDSVNQGHTLSQSMATCEECFPKLMINMYIAGEVSGKLDETAIKMAKYYEGEHKINSKVRNAMAYPTVLAGVTIAVVLILFTYVLPIFFEMYDSSGAQLNILTRILRVGSEFLIRNWMVLLVAAAIVGILVVIMIKRPRIELILDHLKLKMPIIGPLVSIIYTSRFARTMSSLYSSGISMLDAVEISTRTIGNRYLEIQFDKVIEKIRAGQPFSQAMEEVKGIEVKLIATIYIGEESGRLDTMLNAIASQYEFESEAAIDRLLTYIEPLMLVIMACIIGPILVAVMLPMFNMYSLM